MSRIHGLQRLAPLPGILLRALVHRHHPLLAQIVPMRRCNLACSYCNEFDHVSTPVPLATVERWIDRLAELRTEIVTISGGEPMLHPDVDAIIARVRVRSMVAGLISNGYFLQVDRIQALNRAGLQFLQISIDNVSPDGVSQKSLKVLDRKLQNLAEHARFHVNVNSVLGSGCANPEDALAIAQRAAELGFSTSVGIIHDRGGRLRPLDMREQEVYREIAQLGRGMYTRIRSFQDNLIDGRPNDWACRAGARYLYVCEEGRVHYCSQQRGTPGIPLEDYGVDDIAREFDSEKECAPYCTIGCVHRASAIDGWRHGLRRIMSPAVDVPDP